MLHRLLAGLSLWLGLAGAAAAATTISVLDSNLYWSTGGWQFITNSTFSTNGTSAANAAQTTAPGNYVQFNVTGTTSVSVLVDASTLTGFGTDAPTIRWTVNGFATGSRQLQTSDTSVSLITGLSGGSTYLVRLWFDNFRPDIGSRWGASSSASPTNIVRITGFSVDTGGSAVAQTLQPYRAIMYGDSITEGYQVASPASPANQASLTHVPSIAAAMTAEYTTVGYGSQGWSVGGSGSVPAFPSAYNLHGNGYARTLSNVYDYCFVFHGTNDISAGSITATVTAWVTAARAALGNKTWIFVVASPGGIKASEISAGVAAYIAGAPSDTRVKYIDVSAVLSTNGLNGGGINYASSDGFHPYQFIDARYAAAVSAQALNYMSRISAVGGGVALGGFVTTTR